MFVSQLNSILAFYYFVGEQYIFTKNSLITYSLLSSKIQFITTWKHLENNSLKYFYESCPF